LALESQQARRLDSEGAELLERASTWWTQYQRLAVGIVVGVLVLGGGSVFYFRTRNAQEEEAAGHLAEATVLFWQGDYARSFDLAKQTYDRYGGTPSGIEAHRLAGDDAFWNGDFQTAVLEYRGYLDRVKTGLLADAARRSLAYSLESSGQTLEAAKVYEELVGRLDRTSSAEFLVGAARCYRQAGQPAEAIQRLERVEREFGDTFYGQQARIELGELRAAAR
jgi:TolA-binding protein